MSHWCRICNKLMANERFSGKGHKNHICKKCTATKTDIEIKEIDQENEIYNFLKQSNISKTNIKRLGDLIESTNEEIAYYASIVLEVAKIKPGKKKRIKFIAKTNRELLQKLEDTGLIRAIY